MTILHVNLRIKFRVVFVDIYKMDETFAVPLPVPIPSGVHLDTVLFNKKGVFLRVWL